MTDRAAIEEFLAQGTLAFVGVSRDPQQFANDVYRRMRAGGRRLRFQHGLRRADTRIGGRERLLRAGP